MSAKARSLRERMSIDPDAPEPVARPRRQQPTPKPDPVRDQAGSESTDTQQPGGSLAPERSAVSGASGPDPTATEPTGSGSRKAARSTPSSIEETVTTTRARPTSTRLSSSRSSRRKGRDDLGWTSALDDPSVSSGGNGYRSFYVSDEVFARFRAAIYWTSRRPDAADVPDNMSAGIEEYMDQVAQDLERRFNGKDVFPPTPDQLKAHRRRESGGGRG